MKKCARCGEEIRNNKCVEFLGNPNVYCEHCANEITSEHIRRLDRMLGKK